MAYISRLAMARNGIMQRTHIAHTGSRYRYRYRYKCELRTTDCRHHIKLYLA